MKKHIRTKEDYEVAIKESESAAGALRKLGITCRGGNYRIIYNAAKEYNIDTSHFKGCSWKKGLTAKNCSSIIEKPIHKILIENSKWNSHKIKKRLIKEGLKECKCERCGNTEWQGQPIPLELHHINGIHTDNRLENLQILCPNCHALTENYSWKNKYKYKRKK